MAATAIRDLWTEGHSNSPSLPTGLEEDPSADSSNTETFGVNTSVDETVVNDSWDALMSRPSSAPPLLVRPEGPVEAPFDIRLHPAYEKFYRTANDPTLPPPLTLHLNGEMATAGGLGAQPVPQPLPSAQPAAPNASPARYAQPLPFTVGGEPVPKSDADVVKSFFPNARFPWPTQFDSNRPY